MHPLAETAGTHRLRGRHDAPQQEALDHRRPATVNGSRRDPLNACHCGLHVLSQEITTDAASGRVDPKTIQFAYLEITSDHGPNGRTCNTHHKDFCTNNFDEAVPSLDCKCGLCGLCDAAQTVTAVWSHTTDTATGWNTTELTTQRHGLMKCSTSTRRSSR
ncbi:hypothetical protein GCM10009565_88810 [Amycolatopsis albidoflavus]